MEGPNRLPVLHFLNATCCDSFIVQLGDVKHVSDKELQDYGTTHDATKMVPIVIYEWRNKRFGCIISIVVDDMCTSAKVINRTRNKDRMYKIQSIDPTGDYSGPPAARHSNNCSYIRTGNALFDYFDIEPYDDAKGTQITQWIGDHGVQLIPLPMLFGLGDDWANHAQPEVKKVKLDDEWAKKLIPEKQRCKTNVSQQQCIICTDYQKTIVFVPCGHWCCDTCFEGIMTEPTLNKVCPFCKKHFDTFVRPIE